MKKTNFLLLIIIAGVNALILAYYSSFDILKKNPEINEHKDSVVTNKPALESKQVTEVNARSELRNHDLEGPTLEAPTLKKFALKEQALNKPVLLKQTVFINRDIKLKDDQSKSEGALQIGETEALFMDRMKIRMDERKARIQEKCKTLGLQHNWKKIRDFLLTVSEYKTIMCQIPKTGITNWKRLYSDLKGINFNEQSFFVKYQVSGDEKVRRLTDPDWLKMTVVREPMERLISAYRSKIKPPHTTQVARVIQKEFGDKSDPDYKSQNYPTFSTFVKFLVKANSSVSAKRDQHWSKFSDLCHFCDFEYDFIGRQETIEEDSEYFLRLVGAPRQFSLKPGYRTRTDDETAYRYYSTVKPRELVLELYEMLKDEYILFDYPRPSWLDQLFSESQNRTLVV